VGFTGKSEKRQCREEYERETKRERDFRGEKGKTGMFKKSNKTIRSGKKWRLRGDARGTEQGVERGVKESEKGD